MMMMMMQGVFRRSRWGSGASHQTPDHGQVRSWTLRQHHHWELVRLAATKEAGQGQGTHSATRGHFRRAFEGCVKPRKGGVSQFCGRMDARGRAAPRSKRRDLTTGDIEKGRNLYIQ